MLMLIGMISVFIVLLIVVVGGRILISIVNRYFPGQNIKSKQGGDHTISSKTMAVLAATVAHVTGGKGVISEITKK